MRIALRVILAAAIAGLYAAATGYFFMRSEALQLGASIGWNNDDVHVVGPQFPLLPFAGVALLSALSVVYMLATLRRGGRGGYAETAAFVLVLLAVVVWGVLTFEAPVWLQTLDLSAVTWWRYASLSPALHAVLAVVSIDAVAQAIRDRRLAHSED